MGMWRTEGKGKAKWPVCRRILNEFQGLLPGIACQMHRILPQCLVIITPVILVAVVPVIGFELVEQLLLS